MRRNAVMWTRLFLHQLQYSFGRTVRLLGQLCKFELQHSDEGVQQDVIQRCAAARPRHGERWIKISKGAENAHSSTKAILKHMVLAAKDENLSR